MASASASASNSAPHSEAASAQPLLAPKEEQDVSSLKAPLLEPKKEEPTENMDNKEDQEKFERYFAEMTDYITAKYFSDKTMFGGNIYDVKVTTDGQSVRASRSAPVQSFADPATFINLLNNASKSEEDAPAETSNGKQPAKN